jgi:FMN phosphatase YigB (HAD superfamily)
MNTNSIIRNKKLVVFDFDDTLVTSDEHNIVVHHESGHKSNLPGRQWSDYKPKPGDKFDFSDFEVLKNPNKIEQTWKVLLDRLWSHGYDHVWILSARGSPAPLEKYFREHSIRIRIIGIGIPPGSNNGDYKAKWIEDQILSGGYEAVEFYDDREDCIVSVLNLKEKYPHITFHVWQIVDGNMRLISKELIPQEP